MMDEFDIDADMFPDRADIQYRLTGGQDATGGPKPTYQPGPAGLPCTVQDAAMLDATALRVVGTKIDSAVWFPAAGATGAAVRNLKRGSLLTLTTAGNPTPAVQEVVRVDAMGIDDLNLWLVYTTRRE